MPLPTTFSGGSSVLKWLLRDEFTDTRAAGAVNGTAATPGPGTRVVTDTDGDGISVGAGVLSFSNPNAAFGNPGLWYGALVRVTGRVCIYKDLAITDANRIDLGWDSDQAATIITGSRIWTGGNDLSVQEGGTNSVIASVPNATYSFAKLLRTAGVYVFIKGGAFTNWTLLSILGTDVTTPMYPAAQSYTMVAWSIGAIRVPDAIYLPPVLAYDTFTRANGALGNSETAGPDGQVVSAHTWNNRVGTTEISGNTASASALGGGLAIATVDTGTADVVHSAALTRAANEVGIIVRYADSSNYVRAYHDGTNAKLDKVVGGGVTNVISAAAAYGAGRVMRVICQSTSFSLFYHNAKIGATQTIGDAALQSGTEQGLYSTNIGNSQDTMVAMARGSGNEYSGLDRYSG